MCKQTKEEIQRNRKQLLSASVLERMDAQYKIEMSSENQSWLQEISDKKTSTEYKTEFVSTVKYSTVQR